MTALAIRSENEMLQLGRSIGERLKTGDLLFLFGDLGAGKTTLTKGIAKGLAIDDPITSPTFQIKKSYQGRLVLNHLDLYRIHDQAELAVIEPEEALDTGVVIIEWGDLLVNNPFTNYLEIRIKYTEAVNERMVTFRPCGARYESLIKGLNQC